MFHSPMDSFVGGNLLAPSASRARTSIRGSLSDNMLPGLRKKQEKSVTARSGMRSPRVSSACAGPDRILNMFYMPPWRITRAMHGIINKRALASIARKKFAASSSTRSFTSGRES
jgi:hypothetical protein